MMQRRDPKDNNQKRLLCDSKTISKMKRINQESLSFPSSRDVPGTPRQASPKDVPAAPRGNTATHRDVPRAPQAVPGNPATLPGTLERNKGSKKHHMVAILGSALSQWRNVQSD